jgi:dolichyl-phosphate beta-glucosyltransferase
MEADSVASRALHRTILMFGFHILVVILVSKKIKDTQCGFKMFTRATAKTLFSLIHLDRWSFDIELIYLAEALQIPMIEVEIHRKLVA